MYFKFHGTEENHPCHFETTSLNWSTGMGKIPSTQAGCFLFSMCLEKEAIFYYSNGHSLHLIIVYANMLLASVF